ncbi:MAG: nitronate monooxygenase family protein [Promethearchaeota archaeon]
MVISTNVTEMLGIKHPVIAAPMGPFYTTKLTIAVSEAGGLGVLSHTNLLSGETSDSVTLMEQNMLEVVEHTDKPFGFNVRTARMQPDAQALVRRIPRFIMKHQRVREQCVYALTSAGSARMLPSAKSWVKLRESGSQIKHFHVAPSLFFAEKCVAAGVDGLVATGFEGGGHQSYEQISTLVLLQQFREKFPDVPMVACGGFATGAGLAAALVSGAGAVAMGTRFIASVESEFHDNYKAIVPPARAIDTTIVTGVLAPIRLWKNEYTAHHDTVKSKEEKLAQEAGLSYEDLVKINEAYEIVYKGDIQHGAVPLGQSAGLVHEIESVRDVIERVVREAEEILRKAPSLVR